MRSSTSVSRCGLVRTIVGLILFILSYSGVAAAQSTGSIIGQVTDQSGAVLPGVTVTATSPALQVPSVTSVTNEQGEYRLAPLPIGIYQVAFELASFRPAQRQDVRLTAGFIARIDVAMGLATVAETVTVSGAAPVVDVTSTTNSTLLTREQLDLTPTSRNSLMSILALAPGVRTRIDVGGDQMLEDPDARVFGQAGEMWTTLEGIGIASMDTESGSGVFFDYQTVEETRIETMGANAAAPTRGIQSHTIVKSGGNDFHGGALWSQTGPKLQGHNLDSRLRDLGVETGNALVKRYDVGAELGGRVVRNKLWFYGAARKRYNESEAVNAFKPDGTLAHDTVKFTFYTGKVSLQASPSNRLIGFYTQSHKPEEGESGDEVAYESRKQQDLYQIYGKGEWQGVRGNSLIANLQLGIIRRDRDVYPDTTNVRRFDVEREFLSGANWDVGDHGNSTRYHTVGSLTLYKPDTFHGNHEFKVGFDAYKHYQRTDWDAVQPVNYMLFTNDGAPYQFGAINHPIQSRLTPSYLSVYGQDSWTIARRLTLNLGLRYARNDISVPAQCLEGVAAPSNIAFPDQCFARVEVPVWNSVAPRLHFAYDLTGDGKTVFKGGWGRFDYIRTVRPDIERLNRNTDAVAIYNWRDLNGNGDYNPGEVNLNPNGPDFVKTLGNELDEPAPRAVPNKDEKQPKSDEFSVSIERELIPNFAVKVTGIHSRYDNIRREQNNLRPYSAYNIPVTNRDPGPDGRVGTADDGGLLTYYEYSPALSGAQFEEMTLVNDPKARQRFTSVELAAVKRLANRWQFAGSYARTKKDRPIHPSLRVPENRAQATIVGAFNPNDEINRADNTSDWQGKLSGAYIFPYDVTFGVNFDHQSGDAFARQVLLEGGVTIPDIVVNAEPVGTRRIPTLNLLTLRAEKSFRFRTAQRVAVRFDLYNALNVNTTTRIQPRSGSRFLRPTEIVPPRIAEFGLAYSF
jgi:Carboxypeptidase regulatory-like domain